MKTYSILAATLAQINARQSFEAIQNFVPYQELSVDTNQQPVIGILSQQLPPELLSDPRFEGTDSYIMSTYVKYLEESGARVVPLIMGEPAEVTMEKLSKLNGILLPGGDGDYIDWGRPIFDKVKKYNDEGQFYPMWGTCLGFESLAIWASDEGRDVLGLLSAHRISLPIYYTKDPEDTKMFGDLGYEAETFTKSSMLLNSHDYGLSPDKFDTDSGLSSMFTLTSVSYEPEGDHRPFTASMESEQYPFFGTQFHPEKPAFMFLDNYGVNHTWESIEMNQHFANYFVEQTRRNTNTFGDFATVQQQIVQNYKSIVTTTYYGVVFVFSTTSAK